jgi:hypothetical protein
LEKTIFAGCASIQPSCIRSNGSTALEKGGHYNVPSRYEVCQYSTIPHISDIQVTWPTFTSNAGYPGCPVPCMHSRSDVHSAEISHLASIFPGFSRHPAFFATSLSFITTRNSWLTVLATGGDPPPIRFINRVSITHAVYQYETAYSTRIHLSSKYRWFSYP